MIVYEKRANDRPEAIQPGDQGGILMIFCDECINFPLPETTPWNRCLAGQTMKFRMPRSPVDDEWGFHRKSCDYFKPIKIQELSKIFKRPCKSQECFQLQPDGFCYINKACQLHE